jgi:hypothetical protein
MADKVVSLEFNVKTAGAVTEINKVTEATEGATAASNQYEKQLADIKKATEGAGFKDLNKALKQYQDLALQAGANSPIGKQALAEAGELKDKLSDLKTAIRTTGQDGRELQAALQLGGGIVAGFGAVQGVMALVGSESEDLQRTLVKLQAVQATLASVEEIRSVLEKESALRITAVTIAEKARAAATAVSTFVTNGASLSLKAFKAALVATGIGAFIVVLGSVIAYWDELTQAIGLSTKSTADYTAALDKLASKEQRRLNNKIELQKNELKLAELKGESDKQLFEREKKINDLELLARERQRETDQKLIESFQKRRKAGENFTDEEKQRFDELKENEKNYYSDIRKIEFDSRIIEETFYQNEKKKAEEKRKEEAEKLKKAADDRREKEKQWQSELKEDRDKLAKDEKAAAEKKFADDQQLMLARAELFAADLAAQKAASDSKKADEKEVFDTKVSLATQGFDIINQLAALSGDKSKEAAKRAFEINKAFQIAQAIIEGTRGTLKAYSEAPIGFKIASAVAAASFAALQIAKISATKFDSSKFDKTAPKVPGGDLTAAAPTQTTAPQTPGRISNITGNQTTTVKAIVVESDITTMQKRINSIQEIAKL